MAHTVRNLVFGVQSKPLAMGMSSQYRSHLPINSSVFVASESLSRCQRTYLGKKPPSILISVWNPGQSSVFSTFPAVTLRPSSLSRSFHAWSSLQKLNVYKLQPTKLKIDDCRVVSSVSCLCMSSHFDTMAVAEPLASGEEPEALADANAQQADASSEASLLGKGSQDGGEAQTGVVTSGKRFKPMCYYYTQGLCTLETVEEDNTEVFLSSIVKSCLSKNTEHEQWDLRLPRLRTVTILMEETEHINKFSHEYPEIKVRPADVERVKKQPFEYYLVLDLEGLAEILEFPVVMINAQTLEIVDRFHRFVRPVKMTEERQAEYIRGKYGRWGLDRVWHDTAVPFTKVLESFEEWLHSHSLYDPSSPSKLTKAAFVTCGNWDVKTKIPEQCRDSEIVLPLYFNEWINLKDIYYNFYKQRAGGMLAMLKGLKMPLVGTHHVGLDDANNIARVLLRMLSHGAFVKISAKRKTSDPKAVKWTFAQRVK